MGTVVVDANVVIAFLDPGSAQHRGGVSALAPWLGHEHAVLLPASVYAEILVQPFRTGVVHHIDTFLAETNLVIVPIDAQVARRAAQLRAVHSALRLPDAFALAVARVWNATFLTSDEQIVRIMQRDDS